MCVSHYLLPCYLSYPCLRNWISNIGGNGWNQPHPYYQGGNGNSNSSKPNKPTLRDLVYKQANINESLQKKLAANDKLMETIHAKMDGFSTAIKNQLSFNKILETQLAQLAAATSAADLGKILGQPKSTLESVNAVTTRWDKPPSRSPLTSYAEKLTRPRRSVWEELAATIREDSGTQWSVARSSIATSIMLYATLEQVSILCPR